MGASATGTDVSTIVQIGVGSYSVYLVFEKPLIVALNAFSSPALKKLQDGVRMLPILIARHPLSVLLQCGVSGLILRALGSALTQRNPITLQVIMGSALVIAGGI